MSGFKIVMNGTRYQRPIHAEELKTFRDTGNLTELNLQINATTDTYIHKPHLDPICPPVNLVPVTKGIGIGPQLYYLPFRLLPDHDMVGFCIATYYTKISFNKLLIHRTKIMYLNSKVHFCRVSMSRNEAPAATSPSDSWVFLSSSYSRLSLYETRLLLVQDFCNKWPKLAKWVWGVEQHLYLIEAEHFAVVGLRPWFLRII